eukprot:g2477.t1
MPRRGRRAFELTRNEVDTQRLQRQLDQWVDVATELYNVLERQTSPLLPEVTNNKENFDRVDDEELELEVRELNKIIARQTADLNFARQTETSLRNAMVEKSRQLEHITEQSQFLIQHMNSVEEVLKQQQNENEKKLELQTTRCLKLEKCCVEYKNELTKAKEELNQQNERNNRLEALTEDQITQLQEEKHKNGQQFEQLKSMGSELKMLKEELHEQAQTQQEKVHSMKQLLVGKDDTITELKSMTTKLQSKATQNEHQLQTSVDKIQHYMDLLDIQKQRVMDIGDSLVTSQKQNSDLQNCIDGLESENRSLKSEINQLTEQLVPSFLPLFSQIHFLSNQQMEN